MLTWIVLLAVGLALLVFARYGVPGRPAERILWIAGWIVLVLALVFFIFWVTGEVQTGNEVEIDGAGHSLVLE